MRGVWSSLSGTGGLFLCFIVKAEGEEGLGGGASVERFFFKGPTEFAPDAVE